MDILVEDKQTDLHIDAPAVKAIAKAVVAFEGRKYDEVAIHFVSKIDICDLHAEFFDDPSPTDCISFPIDDPDDQISGYRVLGDIFVCPATALEYAAENQSTPFYETTLYIVHGLLHLMGYDDIEEAERVRMRNAEERHMSHLKTKGLWL